MKEVQVRVIAQRKRNCFALRWKSPITGKIEQIKATAKNRSEALRQAVEQEIALRNGQYSKGPSTPWKVFRDRFTKEKQYEMTPNGLSRYEQALNSYENTMAPERMTHVTSQAITAYKGKLFERGLAVATIVSHLRGLKVALRWANRQMILNEVPYIEFPKRGRGEKMMKGRPITEAEFQEMLSCLEKVIPENEVMEWKFFLNGVWESGLRLREALNLTWDQPQQITLDLETGMMRIPGHLQKSQKAGIYPMTPELVDLLSRVPMQERTGPVFFRVKRREATEISRKVAAIGKTAEIVVNTTKDGTKKFASLHDLRRSFGERWSQKLLPQQLKEIMRHESVTTTLQFYVGQDAKRTREILFKAAGREHELKVEGQA